jgi:hypothetical protein
MKMTSTALTFPTPASLGNLDQYTKYQTAEAIRDAAKNPGGIAGVGARVIHGDVGGLAHQLELHPVVPVPRVLVQRGPEPVAGVDAAHDLHHVLVAGVVDVTEGEGKYRSVTGALVCQTPDGKRFSVGSGLTDDDRIKYTENPPVGHLVKVKFLTYTSDGLPFNPTVLAVL